MTIISSKDAHAARRFLASVLMLVLVTMSFPGLTRADEEAVPPAESTPEETVEDTTPPSCDPGFHLVSDECVADEPTVEPTEPGTPLECDEGQVLNEAGDACVDEEPAPEEVGFAKLFTVLEDTPAPYEDTELDGICYAVSDSGTEADGNPATATFEHTAWTHALDGDHGATWIWDGAYVSDPSVDQTVTFTKTISLVNASPATLELASDNEYTVLVNGVAPSCDGSQSNNFSSVESCPITLLAGDNDLVFTVKNTGVSGETNPENNPSGLIYKVTASQSDCGQPEKPVENSCVAPTGSADHISYVDIGTEDNLQEALDSDGYAPLDANADQTNTQSWNGTGNTVNFTAKFLEKNASYHHVFGYYTGGTLGSFTALFDDASAAPGSTYSFSVPNVGAPGVGFAIQSYNNATLVGTWATEKSLNPDGNADHVIVFNPSDDTYVLAFDDQTGGTVDHDYNDTLVEVIVDGCSDGATCDPNQELLTNGSFENPSVTTGALWDIFPSGTSGLGWVATWLAGANTFGSDTRPAVANAEFQKTGLVSGWAASGAGSQWAELDADWYGPTNATSGEPGQVSLTQVVPTIVGETYTFSFDFSPRPDQTNAAQNKVEVLANGTVIGTVGPTAGNGATTQWSSQSFSFVATSTSTTFGVRDAGTPNDSLGSFVDNTSLRCTPTEETPHEVTIVSSKIVCTNEADLPNWGEGGHGPIGATTAADWVAAHESCHLQDDWHFEVADQTGGDLGGDFVGNAGAPYADFGPTVAGTATTVVSTSGVSELHLREVLKDGYIPFTFDQQNATNEDDVSAEFYCSNDVLNYDNWDFIRNPVEGATYYCVAWNMQKPGQCNPDAETVILSSDGLTYDETDAASIVTFLHDSWVDAIDALWIWKDPTTSASDAANGTTETFTRQFSISGAPLDASLDIAVDNNVVIKVNGTVLPTNPEPEFNYAATTTYAVPAALMHSGLNTITFKVTNLDHATANDPETNPAGLLYKLTVSDDQCAPPADPTKVKVHIYKYLEDGDAAGQVPDGSTAPSFPMVSTWSDAGFPNGSGSYVLGNNEGGTALRYAADTSPMDLGSDYTTSEVTDGSVVVADAGQCSEGKYHLLGYRSGDSLAEAQTAPLSATAPSFANITNDKYVLVVNEECGSDNGGGEDEDLHVHIFKYLTDGETTAQMPNSDNPEHVLFPMIAIYDIAGVWTNLDPGDPYTLGTGGGDDGLQYAVNTIALSDGDDYGTHEVTGGDSPVVEDEEQCEAGKYVLRGYKVGDSLLEAQGAPLSETSPFFSDIQNDKYVIVVNEDCATAGDGEGDGTGTLTIVKNAIGGDGTFSFNVVQPEAFSTTTSLTTTGESHSDSETITLTEGDYDVTENSVSGWTLSNVVCVYDEHEEGSAIAGGESIHVESGENVTCTFTNTKNGEDEGEHTTTSDYTVVRLEDLTSDILAAVFGTDNGKWFEYNDSTDTIDNTLGSFVTGPSPAPAGVGSIEFTLAPNPLDRKNIATFKYQGTDLASIDNLSFSAYSNPGSSGAGPTESPYLVMNVDFTGSSSSFQGRLVYVPATNGAVPQNGWNTYDTIDGGTGLWVYSGANWPAPNAQPGTTAKTWSQILLDYPAAQILPLGGLLGVRVGEPGPDGYTGNVDAFVIGIDSGSNTNISTYDFEPTTVPEEESNGGGGGGGGGSSNRSSNNNNDNDGEVLGASTGPECGPLLTSFMGLGMNNDSADVSDLQGFLNETMGAGLPVTGVFGALTKTAVEAFQVAHWDDVLAPWVPFGLATDHTPTGFVYKTTKWKINNLFCPGSEDMPMLP